MKHMTQIHQLFRWNHNVGAHHLVAGLSATALTILTAQYIIRSGPIPLVRDALLASAAVFAYSLLKMGAGEIKTLDAWALMGLISGFATLVLLKVLQTVGLPIPSLEWLAALWVGASVTAVILFFVSLKSVLEMIYKSIVQWFTPPDTPPEQRILDDEELEHGGYRKQS